MLNESKIKVMMYLEKNEKAENGELHRIADYYKYDYIRYHLLKTFLSVTIGYVCILLLAAFYHAEYLIANFVVLDYKVIGAVVLGIYIVMLVFYLTATIITCFIKYDKSRLQVRKYYKILELLRRFYEKEAEQK